MFRLENRDFGKLLLFLTSIFFFYYTLWVLALPFVDEDYKKTVTAYFLPVELALGIPSAIGTSVFLLLLLNAYRLVKFDRDQEQAAIIQTAAANHS